ncbi:CubicO group peptidase (beta-lactamase class C family) [Cytobacillus eiseniae]|uniref:CubicO group peptidase (Beta-lactamase class C family) n=1 Tax=Cytobacillus eiseniae TaxID=762947 RepID=A0ABS4RJ06_9BACI|nr:serine hydrolase domain-containing protein [Cytobacillus eiseniae]MBP2241802.1 CubicO group peptidase (beta-lactamase class C family) [Cytobacillus eiseniae]
MTQKTVTSEFDQYCKEIADKYEIPGFSIGLAKDGQLFYENGFGYRDVENKLPLSSDTVFGIGSVTKSFTCVAVMQLQEAGKLDVNDPVVKYLPEFKTPNEEYTKQMTIHHLMTHSAGLPPLPTLFKALSKSVANDPKFEDEGQSDGDIGKVEKAASEEQNTSVDTYEELIADIASQDFTLLGEPGTEFSYSNDGYSLLGAIIERVSGISYEKYMKDYILDPAGMKNSVFHLEELVDHEDVSCLYNSRKKEEETIVFESNNPWDAPSMRAAGFLKSTVNDMLKYAEIYRNEGKVGSAQLLTPESVKLMTTPYIECDKGTYYGYGVMVTPDYYGHKLVEHGGSIKGVAAQLNILPELGLTGVSFANLAGVPSTKLLFSAFADQLGKSVKESHLSYEVVEVSEEELKQYEGVYASGEGAQYTVAIEDGKLQLKAEGLELNDVKPIGNDTFMVPFRESEISLRFVKGEDNKVIRAAFGYRQNPKVE